MSGLNHEFLLVKKADVTKNYSSYAGKPRYILHDDLLSGIMSSSLKWIPTRFPGRATYEMGLNLNAISEIDQSGALVAGQVFRAWRDLINASPDPVRLHCGYRQDEGGEWRAYVPEFKKAELLENLNGIVSYLGQIGDELSVVHLGV